MRTNKRVSQPELNALSEQLGKNPELFEKIRKIVELTEPDNGPKDRKLDDVEAVLIEHIRRLGNETLKAWTENKEEQVAERLKSESTGIKQREKKNAKISHDLWVDKDD